MVAANPIVEKEVGKAVIALPRASNRFMVFWREGQRAEREVPLPAEPQSEGSPRRVPDVSASYALNQGPITLSVITDPSSYR